MKLVYINTIDCGERFNKCHFSGEIFEGALENAVLFNEISLHLSELQVSFQDVSRSANGMANCQAKQGFEL